MSSYKGGLVDEFYCLFSIICAQPTPALGTLINVDDDVYDDDDDDDYDDDGHSQ